VLAAMDFWDYNTVTRQLAGRAGNRGSLANRYGASTPQPTSTLFSACRRSSLRVKWPEREAGQSRPSSAEVKNEWIYISTRTYAFSFFRFNQSRQETTLPLCLHVMMDGVGVCTLISRTAVCEPQLSGRPTAFAYPQATLELEYR
jgi:hypothetical protein